MQNGGGEVYHLPELIRAQGHRERANKPVGGGYLRSALLSHLPQALPEEHDWRQKVDQVPYMRLNLRQNDGRHALRQNAGYCRPQDEVLRLSPWNNYHFLQF